MKMMIKELIKLANHLDAKGYRKEADHLDMIVNALSRNAGTGDWYQRPVEEPKFKEGDTIQHKTDRNEDGSPRAATVLTVETHGEGWGGTVPYYRLKHDFPNLPDDADRVHHMPFDWAHESWEASTDGTSGGLEWENPTDRDSIWTEPEGYDGPPILE